MLYPITVTHVRDVLRAAQSLIPDAKRLRGLTEKDIKEQEVTIGELDAALKAAQEKVYHALCAVRTVLNERDTK